jgi:hypothetical protein
MKDIFAAIAISRTKRADSGALELQLADASGRKTTIRVSAEIAALLAQELMNFADSAVSSTDIALAKRPKSFAVGTGKYENVILVRFDDDAPYALDAVDAADLGEALIEQSEEVVLRPEKVLQ